jgi:hypothetical protein
MNDPQIIKENTLSTFSTPKITLGLLIFLLVGSSCRAIIDSTEDKTYLTPVPRATLDAFQYDQPIETKLQAVIASQRRIETTHINWLESPQVILVKRMFYKEVIERLEESENETFHDPISPEVSVWFVVFKGKMSITEPLGKTTEPGNLCAFAIINPENGEGYRYGSRNCSRINIDP